MHKKRWRRKTDDEAVRKEIEGHLELEAEDLRARGLDDVEARSAARRAFGNTTLIGEDVRAVRFPIILEQSLQDVHFAVRALRRSPGFAAVALLSLALGIGANIAVFTFVNAAFLKALPYPDADRIVALRQRPLGGEGPPANVHPRSFVAWKEQARSFESLAIAQAVPMNTVNSDGVAEQVPALWVSSEFFRVFGVTPALGTGFTSEADSHAEVILSDNYWRRRFGGDASVIGKPVASGRASALVVGVMPPWFQPPANLKVDLYSSMKVDRNKPEASGSRSFLCFARLRPGITRESAGAEMIVLATRIGNDDAGEREFGVVTMGLRDFQVGENRLPLWVLSGVVGFVLLIACANLAGLLMTRGVGRQNEIAVRAALGAGRWRIMRQLAVESLVLSAGGGALGLFLGWGGSRLLHTAMTESSIRFGPSFDGLDWRVVLFAIALSCFTALLFGLLPAWHASGVELQASVRAHGRGMLNGRRQDRIRSILVVAEVALAVVLLVGAGLLLRTFANLANVKLGFQVKNAIALRTLVTGSPEFRSNLVESMLERVESLPGVTAAGTIQFLPLTGFTNNGPFHFVGQQRPSGRSTMESDVSTVSRGYFAAIGMEVLRGRAFGREDRMDSARVALVNQAFVNRFSRDENPIGKVILGDWANPKPTEIIGVVNDVRQTALTAEPKPTVYLAQSQVPGYFTNIVVRTASDPETIVAAIRHELRNVDPGQPVTDVRTMEQYVSTGLARPRLYANFVSFFSSLALFLAAIGLYGLLAYTVSQRTHEIGLRMALGAQRGNVLWSTMWHGGKLVLAGVILGTASAFAMSEVVSKFLFGVRAVDPVTYGAVALVLGVAAGIATFLPARRAASIDPIVALRCE